MIWHFTSIYYASKHERCKLTRVPKPKFGVFFSALSHVHLDNPPLLPNSTYLPARSPYYPCIERVKKTFFFFFLRYHNTLFDITITACDITPTSFILCRKISRFWIPPKKEAKKWFKEVKNWWRTHYGAHTNLAWISR